jgi:hypothetical protein
MGNLVRQTPPNIRPGGKWRERRHHDKAVRDDKGRQLISGRPGILNPYRGMPMPEDPPLFDGNRGWQRISVQRANVAISPVVHERDSQRAEVFRERPVVIAANARQGYPGFELRENRFDRMALLDSRMGSMHDVAHQNDAFRRHRRNHVEERIRLLSHRSQLAPAPLRPSVSEMQIGNQ